MFCSNCNGENLKTAKFCKLCGTSLHEKLPISPCPNCEELNHVKKVSLLYEELQQKDPSEVEDLLLEEKIAPPEEPKTARPHPLWWFAPFISPINAIAVWFAPMSKKYKLALIGSGIATIGAWFIKFQMEAQYTGSLIMLEQELPHLGMFTLLDLPFITMFSLLCIYYIGLFQEHRRRKKNVLLIPSWKESLKHWNQLFYCSHCNSVFRIPITPGQKNSAAIDDLNSLL